MEKVTNPDPQRSERWLALQSPSVIFRLGWLLVGLAAGCLAFYAHVAPMALLLFLAVVTGISGNWSS